MDRFLQWWLTPLGMVVGVAVLLLGAALDYARGGGVGSFVIPALCALAFASIWQQRRSRR